MPVTLLNFLYHYPFIFIFITGILGLVFMPLVLRVAKERNFVVKPNKRTSHVGAIPTVGGLDIFISFLIFYVIFSYNHLQYSHYLMAGVTLILMTGFIDDLIDLWRDFGRCLFNCICRYSYHKFVWFIWDT